MKDQTVEELTNELLDRKRLRAEQRNRGMIMKDQTVEKLTKAVGAVSEALEALREAQREEDHRLQVEEQERRRRTLVLSYPGAAYMRHLCRDSLEVPLDEVRVPDCSHVIRHLVETRRDGHASDVKIVWALANDLLKALQAKDGPVGDGTYAEFFERVVLDSPRGRELLRSWMCGNASSMVVASFDRGCEAAQKAKESKESKAKEAKKPVKVPKRVRDGLVALFTLQNGSTANAETVLDGAFAGMGVEVEG